MPFTPSIWQDDDRPIGSPLAADVDTEIAIVGGGIGGISSAWHLVQRGFAPLIVDANWITAGATGRSAGFLEAGAADGHTMARRLFGIDRACRIHRATADARDTLLQLAAAHAPDAWARRAGSMRVACDDADLDDARAEFAALQTDGLGGEWLERSQLPAPLQRFGLAGMFEAAEALVHPARLVRGLATALTRTIRIHERTPVQIPIRERDGSAWLLRTPAGVIRAARVVVACDAGLSGLVPGLAAPVKCRRLHCVATAPTDGWTMPFGFHWRMGYEYGQQRPDGRVVLGGYSDHDPNVMSQPYAISGDPEQSVWNHIERALVERLGVTAPVTHRWTGIVGYAEGGEALVGAVPHLPGVYVLGGYCGSGNLNGWLAGRVISELIATNHSRDADLFAAPKAPA